MRRWALVITLTFTAGACHPGAFRCQDDTQCVTSGARGICVIGYCAFPDRTCPSGDRFDDSAGNGLGGTCVPPDGPDAMRPHDQGPADAGIRDTMPAPHVLSSIEVSPSSPILFIDNGMPVTQAFIATGHYLDNTTADLTAMATFSVDVPCLGSFPSGVGANLFTSNTAGGFTKIWAAYGGLKGYTILTLVPRRVDSMGIPLDFFFLAPFGAAPTPASSILSFDTNIKQADVAFIIDSTGSMGSKIANIQSSLSSLAATLKTAIPSVAMGVADYKSWPCSPDGSSGDYPFLLDNRIVTVATSAGLNKIQSAINALAGNGGGDSSEPAFDALYFAATGVAGISCDSSGGTIVPAFNAATAPGSVAGETTGSIGGMGFRTGSLPILVVATDAESHDAQDPADTTFKGIAPYAHGHNDVLAAMMKIGARFVGIASSCGGVDFNPSFAGPATTCGFEPYSQFVWLAEQSGSVVPASAFGGACGSAMCCTGVGGTAVPADASGNCPLVYKVDQSGSGLGSSIADAITKLVAYGVMNVSTSVVGKTTDESGNPLPTGATTANFLTPVGAMKGVTPLDSMPAVGAAGGPTSIDPSSGQFDGVQPGTTVRFTVKAYNDFVPAESSPQLFKATIQVIGNGVGLLDFRDVYVLVPPK